MQTVCYHRLRRLATWQNTPSNPTSTAGYWYDGEGNRVAQTLNGVTTYYVGSDEELTGSTLLKYYHIPGLPVLGTITGVTRTYLASDGLGSETVDLSYNGTVLSQALYGPYGVGRYATGTMPTSKGYTGQRQDSGSGLDYYVSRYYDPLLAQFTSADYFAGSNAFAYTDGNPCTFDDPSGHCPRPSSRLLRYANLVLSLPSIIAGFLASPTANGPNNTYGVGEYGTPPPQTAQPVNTSPPIGGAGPDDPPNGRTIQLWPPQNTGEGDDCSDDNGSGRLGPHQGLSRSQIEAQRQNAVRGQGTVGGKITTGKKYDFNWMVQHLINEDAMTGFSTWQGLSGQTATGLDTSGFSWTIVNHWLHAADQYVVSPLTILLVGAIGVMIFSGSPSFLTPAGTSYSGGGGGGGGFGNGGGAGVPGGYEDEGADHCCDL